MKAKTFQAVSSACGILAFVTALIAGSIVTYSLAWWITVSLGLVLGFTPVVLYFYYIFFGEPGDTNTP